MRNLTIRDVAHHAGVGVGTVSRVLNNSPQVSEATREHVLAVIEQLGFKPNAVARQLPRKTRFKNIGVITPPFFSYYSFAERLRGVQRGLNAHDEDYELLLFNTRPTRDYHARLLSIVQTGVIDGLLIIDLNVGQDQKEALAASGLPYVGLNHISDADWICIATDNHRGGYLAGRYLLERGHRHIAYVGDELVDSEGFVTSGERYGGFTQALAEYGLTHGASLMRLGRFGYEAARTMTLDLLAHEPDITAIFAMSDTQALGCKAAIEEYGLAVPTDVSIIGYDDLEISRHVGLTTIRQHLELSGELGVTYLLQLIAGEAPPEMPRLPDLVVVERDTVYARA